LLDGRVKQVEKEPRPFRAAHRQSQDEMDEEKNAPAEREPKEQRQRGCHSPEENVEIRIHGANRFVL
jgi:hypothetical protein